MAVKRPAMLGFIFLNGLAGVNVFDLDAVAGQDPLAQFQRLGELIAGLEIEDAHARLDLGQHVDDAVAFRSKRRAHGELWKERPHRPAQHGLRRLPFQFHARGGDLLR